MSERLTPEVADALRNVCAVLHAGWSEDVEGFVELLDGFTAEELLMIVGMLPVVVAQALQAPEWVPPETFRRVLAAFVERESGKAVA